MNKESFFLFLAKRGLFRFKSILIILFTPIELNRDSIITDDYSISFKDGLTFIIDDLSIDIDWYTLNVPLFYPKDKITIQPGDLINVKEKIETTYGRILVNQLLLLESGITHIVFKNEDWIKKGVIKEVMDEVATNDSITAEQSHNFVNAIQFVSSLTQLCVGAASEKSMTTDPNIKRRKKELLEKYKDSLDDPAVISKIEQELIQMDKDWLKGDISEGFYKSGKDFNVSRKRLFIMHGGEKSFTDDTKIDMIKFSLEDGWDLNELPNVVNSQRDGSYGRGAATAMGGERVKKFQQTFQNSRISMEDCGSTKGGNFHITRYNKSQFIGSYDMTGKQLTETDLDKHIGKTLEIRSTIYCLAPKTDYCEICSGIKMGENPNIVNTLTAAVGSVFMLIEMKSTHGKELLTTNYDIDSCIY